LSPAFRSAIPRWYQSYAGAVDISKRYPAACAAVS
jgi:hypothetical protein